MTCVSYFYNYNADKRNEYSKFNFGILKVSDLSEDALEDIGVELFEKLKTEAKAAYPDADNINITAFNRI